jgi:hypothetical protein
LQWFAWTAKRDVSWASPVVAAIPFAWGNLSIFLSAANYLIDTYQALNGASALAANGFLRYNFGSRVSPFYAADVQGIGYWVGDELVGFCYCGFDAGSVGVV